MIFTHAMRALTLALSLLPGAALAQQNVQCSGTDLIAALPMAERANLSQHAARAPYPDGLLWHAVRGDTRLTIFGTYHFRHARTDAHLDALKPLIDTADAVYLEASKSDTLALQQQLANDPSIMFLTTGPTLPELLGDADWDKLAAEFSARQIPSFFAAKFKPIWAALMLGLGPCEARNGAMEATGIDAAIGDYAEIIGTHSLSLEDPVAILRLLDSFPQEEQLDMLRLFFDMEQDADDLAYTLRQRYIAQETALLWEYSRKISLESGGPTAAEDFAEFESLLLTTRNRAWVDLLTADGFHGEIFIAFGAGHLPGETGVLNLLANQGFSITRLPFEG